MYNYIHARIHTEPSTDTHSAPAHTFILLAQNMLNNWNLMSYKKRTIRAIGETRPAFTHTCKLYECNNDFLASDQKAEYNIID